jgi:tetratricopeptide (TPR) repeat protein
MWLDSLSKILAFIVAIFIIWFFYYTDHLELPNIEESRKLIILTISLKLIAILFLILALQGQSKTFYSVSRWVLFIVFGVISILYIYRAKYISSYFWVPLMTLINPIVPIYFRDFTIWNDIDKAFIFLNVFSIIFLDLIFYNSSKEQARTLLRSVKEPWGNGNMVFGLSTYAREEFLKGLESNSEWKKNYRFKASQKILDILLKYAGDDPEYLIQKGIILLKLNNIDDAKKCFDNAEKLDGRILTPSEDILLELDFKNYKKIMYTKEA